MNVTCLFEQSGTFKHAFERIGHNAIDVDICNKFGETDVITNVFDRLTTKNETPEDIKFIIDLIHSDLIIAFFPCTWFSNFNTDLVKEMENFKYDMFKTEQDIDNYINARREKYNRAVECLKRLIDLCDTFKIPLIIENPVSTEIIKLLGTPAYTDNNRTLHGDDFKKPTAFYCYGCEISDLDIIQKQLDKKVLSENKGINRSLINPVYADNFVKHINITGYIDITDKEKILLKYD